jgi:holo-[acyl-carrier protein] synthase
MATEVASTVTPTAPQLDVAGVAVGCDVVEVARIARLLARRPAARDTLFTPTEQADAVRDGVGPDGDAAVRRLAARFAAKEAVVKLLGRPAMAWTDVEVRTDDDGAPQLWIHGRRSRIAVSLSHDRGIAMAVVATTTPPARSSPSTPTARS